MVREDELGRFTMEILGLADRNPNAPGARYARACGVPLVTTDYHELFDIPDLHLLIELTGSDEMRDEIERTRPRHVRLIDHFGARLFWELHKAQEAVLAQRAERRRQERAERERITRIYDSIPDEVVVLDTEKRIQHANATCLRNNGLVLASVRGQRCYDVAQKARGRCQVALANCPFDAAMREKKPQSVVRKHFDEEGNPRYSAIVAAPMLDSADEVVGVIEMTRDITHRILVEEQLKASEGRLKRFMELAPLATYAKNRDGQYVEVNRATCELLGRSKGEVVGRTDLELLPRSAAEVLSEGDRTVLETGEKLNLESELVLGGRRVFLSTIKYPVLDADGQVSAVAGLSKDVTEERSVQEALRLTQEYLQNILDNSPIMVVTSDLAGRVVSFNRGAEEMLGYRADEIVGEPATRLYAREEERDQFVRHVKNGQAVHDAEVTFLRKDGGLVDAALTLSELRDSEGNVIGLVGMGRDISHRKALMNQVIQSDRLAAVGRLAAGVAHEINNPLAVISEVAGYLEDLQASQAPDARALLDEELREGLPKIAVQIKRCRSITHRLLNFARKSAAHADFADVGAALDEVLPFLEKEAELAEIRVIREVEEGLPRVRIEEVQLGEIVLNLVKNAIDAIRPLKRGGTIRIRAARQDRRVVLTVQDDGPGIPQDVRDRLFDPFVTTKPQGQGTGLGLSICYGIAKRHGAKIRVESEPGKGATFQVLLRAHDEG